MRENHADPIEPGSGLDECADDVWEAIASLTQYSPQVVALALFTNLEGLLEVLLAEGICEPEQVSQMTARLQELVAGPSGDGRRGVDAERSA